MDEKEAEAFKNMQYTGIVFKDKTGQVYQKYIALEENFRKELAELETLAKALNVEHESKRTNQKEV